MTNYEKYKEDILRIATESNSNSAKKDGAVIACAGLKCKECDFGDASKCRKNYFNWLCEDDGEEPDRCDGCKYEYRPKKTRQDKFLECYPNVRKCKGVIDVCPKDLDMHFYCRTEDSHSGGCTTCCQDYWLQEVEE